VHVVKGAVAAELEPHRLDRDSQVERLAGPGISVRLLRGLAKAGHDETDEVLPFGELHAVQQIVVTGEERAWLLAALTLQRGPPFPEHADEERVDIAGVGVPMQPDRSRPQPMESGT
jgi:hypothetical protein